jgi:hypothetical protein
VAGTGAHGAAPVPVYQRLVLWGYRNADAPAR